MIILILGCCIFWPATTSRGPARSTQCRNHLKLFGLALHNYHDEYGSFPPAFLTDAAGLTTHSWRTLILPYADQGPLASKVRLDEPWDSETNLDLYSNRQIYMHCCPSDNGVVDLPAQTNYVAVVGEQTGWHGGVPVSLDQITDGLDRTILLVEVAPALGAWYEPEDLDFDTMSFIINDPDTAGLSSRHSIESSLPWGETREYVHVLLADCSVKQLPASTPPEVVRALLTINGGEVVELPWAE